MEETSTTPEINGQTTTIVEVVKTVDELTAEVASLTADVARLKVDNDYKTGRIEFYRNQTNVYRTDATRLNELMNEKADEEGWCSKYEEALQEWNGELTNIELSGRTKEYEVSVTITATYYTTVTVEAKSDSDATDMVNDMDCDEIENKSNLDWRSPDDAEFETTDVDLA